MPPDSFYFSHSSGFCSYTCLMERSRCQPYPRAEYGSDTCASLFSDVSPIRSPPQIPVYICLSGMMIAAMIYASIPPPVHPNSTKSSRIRVGAILKYSPMPPHTPQSILFILERYNLLSVIFLLLPDIHIQILFSIFPAGLFKIDFYSSHFAFRFDPASAPVVNFFFIHDPVV